MLTNILNSNKNKWYILITLLFLAIGLLCSLYKVEQRVLMEEKQYHIENIVNYDAVQRAATFEHREREEVYKDLKKAGVTALALYDQTLKKLSEYGVIEVSFGPTSKNLALGDGYVAGDTYIYPVAGKEAYFLETKEALIERLGNEKVHEFDANQGTGLKVHASHTDLMDMNLSLSVVQAKEVEALGFNIIVRPTNYYHETRENVDFTLERIAKMHGVTGIVFVGKEILGYPHDVKYLAKRLQDMQIPIVGIEATTQLQYEDQKGFLEAASLNQYQVGRLYTIPDDYLKKLEPEAASQMFYISDIERNVRYNLFNLYKDGKNNLSPLDTSMRYIEGTKERLLQRGFTLGAPSIYPVYKPGVIWSLGIAFGIIAITAITLRVLFSLSWKYLFLGEIVGVIISIACMLQGEAILWRQILALLAAITTPVCALFVVWDRLLSQPSEKKSNPVQHIMTAVSFTVLASLIASMGGMFIGSLLGSTEFFMEFALFRGVKLTFVMPVVLALLASLARFSVIEGHPVRSVSDFVKLIRTLLHTKVEVLTLVAMGVFIVVFWIFVGRSGHTAGVPVPAFELKLRHFLETVMYARPREKEFLIGYPCLVFSIFAYRQGWYSWIYRTCIVISVIGLGSMVETFAHIRTPIFMSIMRGFDGLWLGVSVGIILVLGALLLQTVYRKYIASLEVPHE